MARGKSRSRQVKKNREKRERERREREERERRQALVDDMNSFLESDLDFFDSFEDFEDALNNPFDDFDVETPPRDFDNADKATEDMKRRYMTSDEKRRNKFKEKYGTTDSQYDALIRILGSDTYRLLKEIYEYDSHQFRETVMSFSDDLTAEDIENALNELLNDLRRTGGAKILNEDAIVEAMEMGFSYDEAVLLTQQDREWTTASKFNIDALVSDYIRSLMVQKEAERVARENIRRGYAERHKGKL